MQQVFQGKATHSITRQIGQLMYQVRGCYVVLKVTFQAFTSRMNDYLL